MGVAYQYFYPLVPLLQDYSVATMVVPLYCSIFGLLPSSGRLKDGIWDAYEGYQDALSLAA